MTLRTFKNYYLFKPSQIIVIDKPFMLNGDEMHAIALTYEEGTYFLWVIDLLSDGIEDGEAVEEVEEPEESAIRTQRDLLKRRSVPNMRMIERIEIGKHIIEFDSFRADVIAFNGNESLFRLQYFIERGVEMSRWDDMALSRMRLSKHRGHKPMPMLNLKLQDEAIKLKFRPYRKKVEVCHRYNVAFNIEKPVELKYYNPFEEIEETFYVHKFETYGLQDYINSLEQNEKLSDISDTQLSEIRERMTNFFESLRARNASLVLMTYEAERVLSFQSKEFLERKVEMASDYSTLGFIFSPEAKFGEYGKRLFIASFNDVPNDQLDKIEFELLSVSKNYKEEQVII